MNAPMRSYGLGVVHKISSFKESGLWGGDQAACGPYVLFCFVLFCFVNTIQSF